MKREEIFKFLINPKKVFDNEKVSWSKIIVNYTKVPLISAIIYIMWMTIIAYFYNSTLTPSFVILTTIIILVLLATGTIAISLYTLLKIGEIAFNAKYDVKQCMYLSSKVHALFSLIPLVLVIFFPITSILITIGLVFLESRAVPIFIFGLIPLIAITYEAIQYIILTKLFKKDLKKIILILVIHTTILLTSIIFLGIILSIYGMIVIMSGSI